MRTQLPNGVQVFSFIGDLPKCLVAQLRTHQRMPAIPLALSCQSSRAVPTESVMTKVPVYVPEFRRRLAGMEEGPVFEGREQAEMQAIWREHERFTLETMNKLANVAPNISKGQINRLLEPHRMTRILMTAPISIWEYFWALRATPNAQGEMEAFAVQTLEAFNRAIKVEAPVHRPFQVDTNEEAVVMAARVSFRSDSRKNILERFKQLWDDQHYGPFEHVVYPTPEEHEGDYTFEGRFVGHRAMPLRQYMLNDLWRPT